MHFVSKIFIFSYNKQRLNAGVCVHKRKIIIFGVISVIILFAISLLSYKFVQDKKPAEFFADYKQSSLSYNLFYPSYLPDGFTLDKNSISTGGGAITYQATHDKEILYFSIQAKPDDTGDLDNIVENKAPVESGLGSAYIGTLNGLQVGSLQSNNSLVLINAPITMPSKSLESVVDNLKKVDL